MARGTTQGSSGEAHRFTVRMSTATSCAKAACVRSIFTCFDPHSFFSGCNVRTQKLQRFHGV